MTGEHVFEPAGRRLALLRPALPVVASLLVNGLLIAVLLTLGAIRQERAMDEKSLSILSLAALKGSAEGEERAAAAEAAARHSVQPPAPTMSLRVANLAPPVPPLPSPVPQSAPPRTSAEATAAAAAATPLATATGALSAMAGQGAAAPRRGIAEGLDADAPAGRSLAYAAKIRSWLYAHKIYPRRARMRREEGVVRVRFVLDRTGFLLEGAVIGSSGKASLDEEAQAMMHRASPYPTAPAAIAGEQFEFIAPIEFMLPA